MIGRARTTQEAPDLRLPRLIGTTLGVPFAFLLAPLLVPGAIWNGYVLRVLWGWFIVPAFGWKPLSLLEATGVVIVTHFLAYQPITAKQESKPWTQLLAAALFGPALVLWAAWLTRLVLR